MKDGNNDLSRGDMRRNQLRRELRRSVSPDRAIVGIDLAERVQEIVVCNHDNEVKARKSLSATRVHELGATLRWARDRAHKAGFDDVVVACEPTGHRWRTIVELCDEAGIGVVCVSPMLVHRERERDDLTMDRSDARDAVLIAGLAAQLRCYVPERSGPVWARLRQLGARRDRLTGTRIACRRQIVDLLGCAWPAVLDTARVPLDGRTWRAAITVVCERVVAGDLAGLRAGWRRDRFRNAVQREIKDRGGNKVCWRIVDAVWEALADPAGAAAQRHGVLERVAMILADLDQTERQLGVVETRMVEILDELGLTALVCTIDGLSAVGAATILAETGDLTRFRSARAVVKHAGLCPRNNQSGTFDGSTTISRRGRSRLRKVAWRVVWSALQNNDVLAARYRHLTTRTDNTLTSQQARVAVAGSMLRQLHAVVTTRTAWDAKIAAGGRDLEEVTRHAA